ncbi:Conserved_hypothetical protein [Hexamita inflata]|uniref:Uncharacterized protein n=2 Tax=Hexamita inflata TaxID=28002 RepID=A0ABP1HZ03_9EUKA
MNIVLSTQIVYELFMTSVKNVRVNEISDIANASPDADAVVTFDEQNNHFHVNMSWDHNLLSQAFLWGFAEGHSMKARIVAFQQALTSLFILDPISATFLENQYQTFKNQAYAGNFQLIESFILGLTQSTGLSSKDLFMLNCYQQFYNLLDSNTERTFMRLNSFGSVHQLDELVFAHSQNDFFKLGEHYVEKSLVMHKDDGDTVRMIFKSKPGLMFAPDIFYVIHKDTLDEIENITIIGTQYSVNRSVMNFGIDRFPNGLWMICNILGEHRDPGYVDHFQYLQVSQKWIAHTDEKTTETTVTQTQIIKGHKIDDDLTEQFKTDRKLFIYGVPSEFEPLNVDGAGFEPVIQAFTKNDLTTVEKIKQFYLENDNQMDSCVGARYDLKSGEQYGQVDFKLKTNNNFSVIIQNGYNPTKQNKIIADSTLKSILEAEQIIQPCPDEILNCNFCSDERFTIEKRCTTCKKEYILMLQNKDCVEFSFVSPIAIMGAHFVILVVGVIVWVWWFFIRK